ncbi:MAG: hypothetical protein AAGC56_07980 [Pseudomonadota bacterium]
MRIRAAFAVAVLAFAATPVLAGDARWLTLTADERAMVDRVAADLFAEAFAAADTGEDWGASVRRWSAEQGVAQDAAVPPAAQDAYFPTFDTLSTAEQAPFRRRAMDALGVRAPSHDAAPPGGARDL